jgi:hypothetical protein
MLILEVKMNNYLGYFSHDLTWWQKLYLRFNPFLIYHSFFHRGTSNTGLSFIHLLERLKKSAKTNEEKQMYELMKKEWSEFNKSLVLGYWNKL